jgi:hypothetical protein
LGGKKGRPGAFLLALRRQVVRIGLITQLGKKSGGTAVAFVYMLIGITIGFLICWALARSEMEKLAVLFEPIGYKLVDGQWTKLDDPTWKPNWGCKAMDQRIERYIGCAIVTFWLFPWKTKWPRAALPAPGIPEAALF